MTDDYRTKPSRWTVAETVQRLTSAINSHGMTLFATIDQQAAAEQAGLQLRATVLLIFGNPVAGTPVMEHTPLAGLDLPLKLQVWDQDGQTQVAYLKPDAFAARYQLPQQLAAPLAGIDGLTDAVLG